MHQLTIKKIGTVSVEGEAQLDVEVEINDGKNTVLRKYGYPLEHTQEEVESDLKNVVAGFDDDAKLAKQREKHDLAMEEVAKMKKKLEGKTLGEIKEIAQEAKKDSK